MRERHNTDAAVPHRTVPMGQETYMSNTVDRSNVIKLSDRRNTDVSRPEWLREAEKRHKKGKEAEAEESNKRNRRVISDIRHERHNRDSRG
jgi:hypothetical protein